MNWTRHLRLKHLGLLITLGETGSLSETARLTFTTQPALSRWLKELEDDVGAPLFERHARGLKPTETGLTLIRHAQRINTEVNRAQQNLDALREGITQTIAIGSSPAAAPIFVPTAVAELMNRHPCAKIEMHEGTMDNLLEQLKLGQLDVVVGRLDNYKPQTGFRSELLYKEKIRVVSKLDHPLADRKNLCWDDLYDYDWIVWPDGTPIRSKLDAALTAAGKKPPRYRVESTSQVGNLWLLKHTDMLSVASEQVTRHFLERGLMTPLDIDVETEPGSIGMCWKDDETTNSITFDMLACFRNNAHQL